MTRSFLLHVRHFECQCSNVWTSSELYHITVSGDQRRIEPWIGEPDSNWPFGVSVLPPRKVAVCFDCAAELEAKITLEMANRVASWQDTLRRKNMEEPGSRIHFTQGKPGGQSSKKTYIPSAGEL